MINQIKIPLLLIAILAASRFIPHPPNATAILALALFGGATISNKKVAAAVVLLAMLLSDLVIGMHSTLPFVYGSILLLIGYGAKFLDIKKSSSKLISSVNGSLIFFFVTNFGVWLVQDLYPKTGAGLIASFVAGVPFLFTTILSTLVYLFAASFLWQAFELKEQQPIAIK